MKKKNNLKDFDDILEFLSNDPEHIISQLKKNKTFINDWIGVFLKEKLIIEPKVKWVTPKITIQNGLFDFKEKWTN